MDSATSDPATTRYAAPYNVQPCRRDPVFGLIKDRWRWSPGGAAGMFLVIYLGGNFLFSLMSGTAFPRPGLDLPFVRDRVALVLYGFLVPVGISLAMRFYAQVESAFERIFAEGVVRASLDEYNQFLRKLDRLYNSVALHVLALALALAVFGYLTCYNETNGVRAWLNLSMGPGAVYQLVLGLIAWYSAHVVLCKVLITAWAISRVFDWPVNVQPLHPDGCGGFRLFTDVAVTIAFFTATMGMGVVLIILAGAILYGKPPSSIPVLLAVLLESATPLVFFTCLYRAHRVMHEAKGTMLRQIHEHFQGPFRTLQQQMAQGDPAKAATEEVLRLESLHQVVHRMPVWPTNTQMLMQVVISVAVPLGLLVLQMVAEKVMK